MRIAIGYAPNEPSTYKNVIGSEGTVYTMIQIFEIRSKRELLQHFLSKWNTLIAGLLVKKKTGYVTHNGTGFIREMIK